MTFEPFLACLSAEALNTSYDVAYRSLAFSGGVFVLAVAVAWFRRRFSWLAICIALLAFQPAWRLAWGEIRQGYRSASADCGFANRGESIFLAALLAAVLVMLIRRKSTRKYSFLLTTTILGWIVGGAVTLLQYNPPRVTDALSMIVSMEQADRIWATIGGGATRLTYYVIFSTFLCIALPIFERVRSHQKQDKGKSLEG